jgi:hypothetical protein
MAMPQIWMTYDEIASMTGCSHHETRDQVVRRGLARRTSRDGQTRVKLDGLLTGLFLTRIRGGDLDLDNAIVELRQVSRLMRSPSKVAAA